MQALLQRMEDFRTAANRLQDAVRADRHDHEFLEIDRVVSMFAAIDDIHHRHRQDMRADPADVAIERQATRVRRRLRHRQADAQDRIGAQPALVLGAVQLDQRSVDLDLVLGLKPADGVGNLTVHRLDRIVHALAEPAALVAITLLDRLMCTGRCARRHGCPTEAAVLQEHVDFHRGITAAVDDLTALQVDDCGHVMILLRWRRRVHHAR